MQLGIKVVWDQVLLEEASREVPEIINIVNNININILEKASNKTIITNIIGKGQAIMEIRINHTIISKTEILEITVNKDSILVTWIMHLKISLIKLFKEDNKNNKGCIRIIIKNKILTILDIIQDIKTNTNKDNNSINKISQINIISSSSNKIEDFKINLAILILMTLKTSILKNGKSKMMQLSEYIKRN